MSYSTHAAIAGNGSIRLRVAACAAQEGQTSPKQWADQNIWTLVKSDWIAAWNSAEAANPGEDHGTNEAAVTDGMILASVQAAMT
jgi:hypothetical protein